MINPFLGSFAEFWLVEIEDGLGWLILGRSQRESPVGWFKL